jgi:hypothetical protein
MCKEIEAGPTPIRSHPPSRHLERQMQYRKTVDMHQSQSFQAGACYIYWSCMYNPIIAHLGMLEDMQGIEGERKGQQ